MATPPAIHLRVHNVGREFVKLTQALGQSSQHADQIAPERIEDEFDRFKIWAGNIAAHRKGLRSLEYRLRDAAHLQDETKSLLTDLERPLRRAVSIVNGEETPWDALQDSDSDSDAGDDTELKQLFKSIKSSVTCLFRLSMAIRDPVSDDRLRKTITVDKSHFEQHDILHTRAKYPDCANYLAERLGRAISGRRQYLSYRELHHQKLTKNVERIGLEQPRTEHTSNSTEATTIVRTEDLNVLDEDDSMSQTSYATSVNATIRVPPIPKEARGEQHFECPLCFMIVSIHTTAAWKQHVYRDLHPYSCTFEQCPMADHLYESRNAWFQHELEAHRSSWQCIPGCDISLTHEKDFDTHLLEQHTELASAPMIAALKRTARRAGNNSEKATCPFCNIEMLVKGLKRHIGRHQEQLALFALPQNFEATDEDKQDGETISSIEVVDVEGWKNEQLSDFSDSENPNESSVSQPNAGQREVVWCAECQEEWYRDQLYYGEQGMACVHGHPIKEFPDLPGLADQLPRPRWIVKYKLSGWLAANKENPYPSDRTRQGLAQECGITEEQVDAWLSTARNGPWSLYAQPLQSWHGIPPYPLFSRPKTPRSRNNSLHVPADSISEADDKDNPNSDPEHQVDQEHRPTMTSTPQLPGARPGPSSYWSVVEQGDFQKCVAYFGTDWVAIASYMGTKTQTMVKNQYLRLVEGGAQELERMAEEADERRNKGVDLGPPPDLSPMPPRRYGRDDYPNVPPHTGY